MNLKSLNSLVKQYLPLIEAIGIVGAVFALFLTFLQTRITNKALELSQIQYEQSIKFDWGFEITQRRENVLNDKIIFYTKNPLIELVKTEILFYDSYNFKSIILPENEWETTQFKNILMTELQKYFTLTSNNIDILKFQNCIPICIRLTYFQYGRNIESVVLCKYHFRTYSVGEKIAIKTLNIETINNMENTDQIIRRSLMRLNLNECYLSLINNAKERLISEKIKSDSTLSLISDFIKINLKIHHVIYKIERQDKKYTNLHYDIPSFLIDENVEISYRKLLKKIIFSSNTDKNIIDSFSKILDFLEENKFFNFSFSKRIDKMQDEEFVSKNDSLIRKWIDLNKDLELNLNNSIDL